MGVQHLLKLRMASPHPHPAPLAARPLTALASSFFLAPPSSTAARSPPAPHRHVTLSCSRPHCKQWGASRYCGTVGRRLPGVVAMSSSAPPPPGSVQKSEEEWEAILSPEQFRILRLKGTEMLAKNSSAKVTKAKSLQKLVRCNQLTTLLNMTSSSLRVFMNVLDAGLHCTNRLQNSTRVVVGQHFTKDFLEPSHVRLTLMAGE